MHPRNRLIGLRRHRISKQFSDRLTLLRIGLLKDPLTDEERESLLSRSVENLGENGFCDIVARILFERFPNARLCHLPGEYSPYHHVFLVVDNKWAIDIRGCRSLDEFLANWRQSEQRNKCSLQDADWAEMEFFFSQHGGREEEVEVVAPLIRQFVEDNQQKFVIPVAN